MKKSVLIAILGLSVAAVSSYGQGAVAFNTYIANHSAGIITTFGNGPSLGSGVGSTFHGELLWSLTNPNDVATTAGTAGASLNPLLQLGNSGGTGLFNTPSTILAGYISAPDMQLTLAQLGAATTIFCEVVVFNGTGWNSGSTTYQGHSASFSVTPASGLAAPGPDQIDNMAAFSVFQTVPEPTTMALGGLGLAALVLARRKKA